MPGGSQFTGCSGAIAVSAKYLVPSKSDGAPERCFFPPRPHLCTSTNDHRVSFPRADQTCRQPIYLLDEQHESTARTAAGTCPNITVFPCISTESTSLTELSADMALDGHLATSHRAIPSSPEHNFTSTTDKSALCAVFRRPGDGRGMAYRGGKLSSNKSQR